MLVYYTGFGPGEQPLRPGLYPRTTNTLRLKVRRATFLQYAEYNAGLAAAAAAETESGRNHRRTAPSPVRNARGPAFAGPLEKSLAC